MATDSLELALQAFVIDLTWQLGTEFRTLKEQYVLFFLKKIIFLNFT